MSNCRPKIGGGSCHAQQGFQKPRRMKIASKSPEIRSPVKKDKPRSALACINEAIRQLAASCWDQRSSSISTPKIWPKEAENALRRYHITRGMKFFSHGTAQEAIFFDIMSDLSVGVGPHEVQQHVTVCTKTRPS